MRKPIGRGDRGDLAEERLSPSMDNRFASAFLEWPLPELQAETHFEATENDVRLEGAMFQSFFLRDPPRDLRGLRV